MTSDLDIYRSANVLIREHGEDAALDATTRAIAMLDKGDLYPILLSETHLRGCPARS